MTRNIVDPRIAKLNITESTAFRRYTFARQAAPGERIEPLGVGGSSVVYMVHQQLDDDRGISIPRALKLFVMREDLVPEGEDTSFMPALSNFLEEVSNISQLSHENLVQVMDAGEEEFIIDDQKRKVPYLVTHLIKGCTLRDVMEGHISGEFARAALHTQPELAVKLLVQISSGLAYLHSRGFLHCDVAPKNIFIENSRDMRAIVGDVGMSRQIEGSEDDQIFVAGTKLYSPPDIAEYFAKSVPRSRLRGWFPIWDIYGFSKTAKEFLHFVSTFVSRPWLVAATNKSEQVFDRYNMMHGVNQVSEQIEYCLPIHRERGGVPELEPNTLLTRKKMMPIEALSFTKRIDKVVRHPALMRLQGVPQLTIVKSVSPGGNHTRYEHSLGVMENVRRMLSTLLDESSFLGVLSKHSIETGLLASLLYNASRFPFSNIIHELNKRLMPGQKKIFGSFDRIGLFSEVLGQRFKSFAGFTLEELITTEFPSVDIVKLRRVLTVSSANELVEPDEAVLYALLNSSLDARVIDFVRRDSLHLGLSSGDFFDLNDLLPHLIITPATAGGSPSQVSLKMSGVSVAEQIILMRYWLYQRVYWNQPNRAYNAIIRRALLDLLETDGFEGELRGMALMMDEREMIYFLHEYAVKNSLDGPMKLLQLVVGHEKALYWEAFQRNLRQCDAEPTRQDRPQMEVLVSRNMSYSTLHSFELQLSTWLAEQLKIEARGAPLVLLDVPFEPGNIKLGADIFVSVPSEYKRDSPALRTLEKVSPVIAGVNQNFCDDLQRLRIFLRPDVRVEKGIGGELYEQLRKYITA